METNPLLASQYTFHDSPKKLLFAGIDGIMTDVERISLYSKVQFEMHLAMVQKVADLNPEI